MAAGAEKIGVVTDPAFSRHDTGAGHPESSDRLKAVEEAISVYSGSLIEIKPRPASLDDLHLIHDPGYVREILDLDAREIVMIDPDTAFSPHSKEAALKAVGGVLDAIDRIAGGDIKKAFCAVRPPGHHAEPNRAGGFCIFNNVAIGAAYALAKYDFGRVAIIDWDLHHGNGTQCAFYESDKVLYISMHQYPYYPGSGSTLDTGESRGEGYTVNIPMAAGSTDDDYRQAFENAVLPTLTEFKPDIVFISAGFDAHIDDPLGGMSLSSEFFGEMTTMIRNVAEKYCCGRIVSVLEGGYSLSALKASTAVHLRELIA